MNESCAGRDGWILAGGRRFYHVYKQNFPMEFWYGLTPDANREGCDGIVDVRTLPAIYRKRPVEVRWTEVPRQSFVKVHRQQLIAHMIAFGLAVTDGYNFGAHVVREREKAAREWADYRARRELEADYDDVPF